MKKLFLNVHKNGNVTTSNYPIQDGDAKLVVLEVSQEEFEKAMSGAYRTTFKRKKLGFEELPEPQLSPKKKQRLELKKKIESGTATDEDVKNALKLLLF